MSINRKDSVKEVKKEDSFRFQQDYNKSNNADKIRTSPLKIPDSSSFEKVEDGDAGSIIDMIQANMASRAMLDNSDGDEDSDVGVMSQLSGVNWRQRVLERYVDGDVEGMIREAAPVAQLSMIEVATEGSDEKVRMEASKHILAQAGHGGIAKVETTYKYNNLPEDQIVAMVMSKMKKIGKLRPELMEKMRELMPYSGGDGGDIIEVIPEEVVKSGE